MLGPEDTCSYQVYMGHVISCCISQEQYLRVLERTSANGTFVMGSHVMQYGAVRIAAEHASSYMGQRGKAMRSSSSSDKCLSLTIVLTITGSAR
jgi:hypothetical protein